MKDYSIGESKKKYILRIEEDATTGTFTVVFADGTRLTDVEANEANLRKVIATQDKQAKTALANKAVFVGRRTKAGFLTGFSAAASLAAATAISSIPAVEQMVAGQNPVVVAAGIGMITILGSIPAVAKLFRESEKVAELDKLQYVSENEEKLRNFRNYHNALSGLRRGVAEHFRSSEDPYCILDIDEYEKKDLEIIMENIEKEESFGFTYKKSANGPAKK
ncbi:MAG: hypothetical protein IJZ46_05230 [Bacilli bacterium]|nr:hypothetical protein [Bacilli bacterium]